MKTLPLVLHLLFIIMVSSLSAKPNVLFIISDDLTSTASRCYGNKVCKTPNIDRLASRGTCFTRAYCQGAYCGPSRASFMSGYYPHATGVQGYTSPRPAIGNRATWSQHFKNSGYYAARVSKIFHMGVPGGIEEGATARTMQRHGPSVSTARALNGRRPASAKHSRAIPMARNPSWAATLSSSSQLTVMKWFIPMAKHRRRLRTHRAAQGPAILPRRRFCAATCAIRFAEVLPQGVIRGSRW